jgi:hypothetical protein
MSSFQEGYQQGKVIGNLFTLGFRIMWFFTRIIWWLGIFLICSVIAGIASLVKMAQHRAHETADFGSLSPDGTRWQAHDSGQWYPVSEGDQETCEIQAAMGGLAWRRNALSRLVKRGAMFRYTFAAVSRDAGGTSRTVASQEFLNEARRNITLDHLDPAHAAEDPYNLGENRREAESALDHLDWLLTSSGWSSVDAGQQQRESESHWYTRHYQRPIILWDQPIGAAEAPGVTTGSSPD